MHSGISDIATVPNKRKQKGEIPLYNKIEI